MIYIAFGEINLDTVPKQYVRDIDGLFDGFFEDEWMQNDIAKRAIEEIDSSKIVAPKVIDSPILGVIPYTWISGGSKLVIMMNAIPDVIYDGNNLGDNCWPLFLEIGKTKDLAINLSYYPKFEWPNGCLATNIDTREIISSFEEFRNSYTNSTLTTKERDFNDIKWPFKYNPDRFDPGVIDF